MCGKGTRELQQGLRLKVLSSETLKLIVIVAASLIQYMSAQI